MVILYELDYFGETNYLLAPEKLNCEGRGYTTWSRSRHKKVPLAAASTHNNTTGHILRSKVFDFPEGGKKRGPRIKTFMAIGENLCTTLLT